MWFCSYADQCAEEYRDLCALRKDTPINERPRVIRFADLGGSVPRENPIHGSEIKKARKRAWILLNFRSACTRGFGFTCFIFHRSEEVRFEFDANLFHGLVLDLANTFFRDTNDLTDLLERHGLL